MSICNNKSSKDPLRDPLKDPLKDPLRDPMGARQPGKTLPHMRRADQDLPGGLKGPVRVPLRLRFRV